MTVFLNDEIIKEKIPSFFRFAGEISDCFTVSRRFNGKIPKQLLNKINAELKEQILLEDTQRRDKYKKDDKYVRELKQVMQINSKKQALKYFDDVKKHDLKAANSGSPSGECTEFKTDREDFIDVHYSKQSALSRGYLFEICKFKKDGQTLHQITSKMNCIYDRPYTIDDTEFDDIAFYNGNQLKVAISSKERFCFLDLTNEEFTNFVKLKLTHELN